MVGFDIIERLFTPRIFTLVYLSGLLSGLASGMLGLGAVLAFLNSTILGISHGSIDATSRNTPKSRIFNISLQLFLDGTY